MYSSMYIGSTFPNRYPRPAECVPTNQPYLPRYLSYIPERDIYIYIYITLALPYPLISWVRVGALLWWGEGVLYIVYYSLGWFLYIVVWLPYCVSDATTVWWRFRVFCVVWVGRAWLDRSLVYRTSIHSAPLCRTGLWLAIYILYSARICIVVLCYWINPPPPHVVEPNMAVHVIIWLYIYSSIYPSYPSIITV